MTKGKKKAGRKVRANQPVAAVDHVPKGIFRYKAPRSYGTVISRVGKDRIRFSRTEHIRAFTSSGTSYNHYSLQLNPGLSDTFPWLCNVAASFEVYKFHRLRFFTSPTIGTANPGRYVLNFDTDANDAPPADWSSSLASAFTKTSNIWLDCELIIPSEALTNLKRYYTRRGDIARTTDLKTTDVGQLTVGFYQVGSGNAIDVWVDYDIELWWPQVEVPIAGSMEVDTPVNVGSKYGLQYNGADIDEHGIMPFEIAVPSTQEILDGATGALPLLRSPGGFSGLVTVAADDATSDTTNIDWVVGPTASESWMTAFAAAGSEFCRTGRVLIPAGSWLQPWAFNAANPVVKLALYWAYSRYNQLEKVI